jgi:hypothetical protein
LPGCEPCRHADVYNLRSAVAAFPGASDQQRCPNYVCSSRCHQLEDASPDDDAGLNRTYISGIERVVRNLTITVMDRIVSALECKHSDLLD